MKFIDQATIEVQSGKGGAGARSFRREKFVPMGGPDGGNGGNGGSVIIKTDPNKHTLLDFKFNPIWKAESGRGGEGRLKDGRAGEDLIILVPIGTQVINPETNDLICDLDSEHDSFILAKGGRGGKGNTFFKSSTDQAPEHFQPGKEGFHAKFILNLKLVADVGIIGMPNAGKSTFISRVSAAKPKIADYPFTTLTPNLGVVKAKDGNNFVVADIPGLIPGAHSGKGLGIQFLKHVERTKILLHLIDPFATDESGEPLKAIDAYNLINNELSKFSDLLTDKKQIVCISKIDALNDREELEKIKEDFDCELLCMSSVSGEGLDEVISELGKLIKTPAL